MKTIACYGDSLVEGFPFSPDVSWTAVAAAASGGALRLLNHGICGECTDDIADRLCRRPLAAGVTHILFQGGMNDILQGRPLRYTLHDFTRAFDFSVEKNLPLAFVLPWLTGDAVLDGYVKNLRLTLEQHFSRTVFLLDFQPCLDEREDDAPLFLDGVHPTLATYKKIGLYAAPRLMEWANATPQNNPAAD